MALGPNDKQRLENGEEAGGMVNKLLIEAERTFTHVAYICLQ